MTDIYCIVDTETTGLNERSHDIIEVAAVRLVDGVVVGRLSTLVWPGPGWRERADPKALEVNRIDPVAVEQAPPTGNVAFELALLLDGATLVAHIAPFDAKFLGAMFDRCGLKRPHTLRRLACTQQKAREMLTPHGLPSTSMDAIRAWMVELGVSGWEVGGDTHRAERDVEDCLRLFRMLWRKDRGEVREALFGAAGVGCG